ncbi:glycosyltransferase family 39 protein [Methyloligella sp. 2.7D]|uniref:glycosyltransferase family 39 protein n=1 Tax=unclassified Methyloligella TaxID=2625955 RepID=UPI00157D63B8|nr:glycosyltransferase family 39 protein [Methyloligella sp. GL2]QKP77295.1 glycosyltransferase family 39 protein [Methyloligella sp. GL2]
MTAKRLSITVIFTGLVLGFLAVLAVAILREAPESNSYALLADAFLHGRFDVSRCFDEDCARFGDKYFVVFPPLPAVIAMPFVAIFGVEFHYFMLLSMIALAATAYLWWRIGQKLVETRELNSLLVLLVVFATPIFFVTLRGDKIWFFAQSWGFLFASAAIYAALIQKRALLTGLFIGLAFLCRQMSILYLPFLYVLLLDDDTPLFRIDGAALKRGLSLAAFPLLFLAGYLAYNAARFGAPLETGYKYLFPRELDPDPNDPGFIKNRLRELGSFSTQYLPFNVLYMFVQGPHLEFVGKYKTEFGAFDNNGASLFLVTPALLFAFLARWNRAFWFGLITCAAILGVTLFYHSNGFSQYSAQRYALDWLPILLVFMCAGWRKEYTAPLSLLIAYSMTVTLAMIAIGGMLAS